jgi:hypothetical protein
MQASLKGDVRFDAWHERQQEKLRGDPLARFFHDFRTVTQHIGVKIVGAGIHGADGTFHYFVACPDMPIVPEQDVVSACEANFARMGRSIEDGEEELGLRRKWADIGRPDPQAYRWEHLRRQADGCLIDQQFMKWLGKLAPRIERLPPMPDQAR